MVKNCLICNKEFSINQFAINRGRGKFCCRKCYELSKRRQINKVCQGCGKMFTVSPSEEKRGVGKFCSKLCSRTGKFIECVVCGKKIWRSPSEIEKNKTHCSWECYQKNHIVWNRGVEWPDEFKKRMSKKLKGRRLNSGRTLFFKGDQRISGENNNHWNGGTTSEVSKRVNDPEWKKIRVEVYKRDNWTCQNCGKHVHKGIQCHHIVPWKISKSNDMTNLTTLCTPCHGKVEYQYAMNVISKMVYLLTFCRYE